jgi:hypothetical protein
MSCPSDERLFETVDGEPADPALLQHVQDCPVCARKAAAFERLRGEVASPQAGRGRGDDFLAGVMAEVSRERPVSSRRRLIASVATVAAVAVAAPLVWMARRPFDDGTMVARGGPAARADAARVSVYVLRGQHLRPLTSGPLDSDDQFVVRWSNPGRKPRYFMVLAQDAAGDIHWLFPAHQDPAQDPRSVPMAPGRVDVRVEEMAAPDGPAPGPFRVITLVTDEPVAVSQIERRLASAAPDRPARLPGAVEEWPCQWRGSR